MQFVIIHTKKKYYNIQIFKRENLKSYIHHKLLQFSIFFSIFVNAVSLYPSVIIILINVF
jgi:hypothetical protein